MKQNGNNRMLEMTGLCLLGTYCLLSSIFIPDFAKLHASFPFCNFPLFIGEIVLLLCLAISVRLIAQGRIVLTRMHGIFFGYLVIILSWVIFDCVRLHQSLALRNGTLFIYPIFAFFTYSFYHGSYFTKRSSILLAVLLYLAAFSNNNGFPAFIYFMLFLVVISNMLTGRGRYIIFAIMLLIWPYGAFLEGARTWLVSSVVSIIFLIIILVKYILPIDRKWKILASCCALILLLSCAAHFADKGGLKTLFSPGQIIKNYQENKAIIKQREAAYSPRELPVNLYNTDADKQRTLANVLKKYEAHEENFEKTSVTPLPEMSVIVSAVPQKKTSPVISISSAKELHITPIKSTVVAHPVSISASVSPTRSTPVVMPVVIHSTTIPVAVRPVSSPAVVHVKCPQGRDVEIAYNNITFRLVIWEDMIKELWEKKYVLGVGMGHPQRSRNIEILGWAAGEWNRDGWITPHNSFLHLIYRAGVLGLAIIVIIVVVLAGLIKDFIRRRSYSGILLTAVIIYGLAAANFLLVLELPYYAIPFWSVFGLTLVYRRDICRQPQETVS